MDGLDVRLNGQISVTPLFSVSYAFFISRTTSRSIRGGSSMPRSFKVKLVFHPTGVLLQIPKGPCLLESKRLHSGNRVVIDCSASQEIADMYPNWLTLGIHVITANKKAGSGPMELYEKCRKARKSAQWYYETTGPGSGLPVLTTLRDMLQSGDRVYKVEGIFSGTMSFLVNSVASGVPLSASLLLAHKLGLCEPDARDDLIGLDTRRKASAFWWHVCECACVRARARVVGWGEGLSV